MIGLNADTIHVAYAYVFCMASSMQLSTLSGNWVQVLEKLYRSKWGALDGLGALVISPTRELALQIFDELRKIGKKHELSAGLLIGGKKVKEEQERVHGESASCA